MNSAEKFSTPIPTLLVGPFDMSDDFVNADPRVYQAMSERVYEYRRNHGYQSPIGRAIEYFEGIEEPGTKIYASFLGRIALDLRTLVTNADTASGLIVGTYPPAISKIPASSGKKHRDIYDSESDFNLRYLVMNNNPTWVEEIGTPEPGQIVRMTKEHSMHQQPAFFASPDVPRVRLAVDV